MRKLAPVRDISARPFCGIFVLGRQYLLVSLVLTSNHTVENNLLERQIIFRDFQIFIITEFLQNRPDRFEAISLCKQMTKSKESRE